MIVRLRIQLKNYQGSEYCEPRPVICFFTGRNMVYNPLFLGENTVIDQ